MVAKGKISVNGKISSVNSNKKTTLLPGKRERMSKAAMGAQITSVTSPMIGMSSDEVPIKSMKRHWNNLTKSGVTLL
jgi:hypothetical protein